MLAVLGGCSSDGGETTQEAVNSPPEITELLSDLEGVLAQTGTANLSATASDPDGDTLEFDWTVSLGSVEAGAEAGVATFMASPDRGTATVTLLVTDGNGGEDSMTLDIGVLGFIEPGSAANVPVGSITFNGISFAGPDFGVAVGGDHTTNVPSLFTYRDGAWVDETAGTAGHLMSVVALSPTDVWTAGGGGLAYHSDGSQWSQFTIPGGCVHGMTFFNPSDGWVTPAEGQPYMRRYTGGAVNEWQNFTAPASGGINGVSMSSDSDGWAVGNGGTILRFNGTDWQTFDSGTTNGLTSVVMRSPELGWAVGTTGTILEWDGTAWTTIESPVGPVNLNGVFALADDDVWAVGNAGMILHYDGSAWMQVPSPVSATLMSVFFTSPSDGWIAGAESTILHLE